jgi:ABC-2 type transport system ATP-binding protein
MSAIMECRDLTKSFGSLKALNQINFSIEPGRIVGLLGPNGSGKTTLIKVATGLLTPNSGSITICGLPVDTQSKLRVSYLPDKNYLNESLKVSQIFDYFNDFYSNFQIDKAYEMLSRLNIDRNSRLKTLSKGTKEKVQLILVMSRKADLYLLDEPIGGVDPAARDYILNTILSNYNEEGSILISTHLISDIEPILDDVIFIKDGTIVLTSSVDTIREENGKSVDALFREVFKC